ncbi:hypothetical protein VKT23_010292 [Stygiomarasmius scandens]|uniref:ATP synthase protein MI25 n=1 Tax=Marasmiellus scandens TaxID=2682957 RepID=A0ABR1JB78_9AGAR
MAPEEMIRSKYENFLSESKLTYIYLGTISGVLAAVVDRVLSFRLSLLTTVLGLAFWVAIVLVHGWREEEIERKDAWKTFNKASKKLLDTDYRLSLYNDIPESSLSTIFVDFGNPTGNELQLADYHINISLRNQVLKLKFTNETNNLSEIYAMIQAIEAIQGNIRQKEIKLKAAREYGRRVDLRDFSSIDN